MIAKNFVDKTKPITIDPHPAQQDFWNEKQVKAMRRAIAKMAKDNRKFVQASLRYYNENR